MDDEARYARVIRVNTIAAILVLAATAIGISMVAAGVVPLDGRSIVQTTFGLVIGGSLLLSARSARKDLADPAGAEGRFQREAWVVSGILTIAGFAVVIAIIAWGSVH